MPKLNGTSVVALKMQILDCIQKITLKVAIFSINLN
jgi:hypothetical protein